jgi:hypothetical protein
MLTLNKQSTILTLEEEKTMSKREKIMSKWKDYIIDMSQSVENMNGRLVMITDMTLLVQPIIEKLGAYDTETLYKEFGPFSIRYEYGGTLIEIHLKEMITHE